MRQTPSSMKAALMNAIARMTEAQAIDLWKGVGEYAENGRVSLDERPEARGEAEERALDAECAVVAAAEKLTEAGSAYLAGHARAPGDPQGDLHLPADTCADCDCTHGPDHKGTCACADDMPFLWDPHAYVTPACPACGRAA